MTLRTNIKKFKDSPVADMLFIWKLIASACLLEVVAGVAPVCSPAAIAVQVGTNTTAGTTLATVSCTDADANHAITYSVSDATDGYTYFGMAGTSLVLVNRLDLEFGGRAWSIQILAVNNDTMPNTGMVTVSLTTYLSTITTTTTPAPPGYSWFNNQDNVILFGVFFAVVAIVTGTCILLCFRFHRVGTCLPTSCPEYGDCRASFRRQVKCCPLPCDFGKEPDYDDDRKAALVAHAQKQGTRDVLPEPEQPQEPIGFVAKEQATGKKAKQERQKSEVKEPKPDDDVTPDRKLVVSPVVIGNVHLHDVGFDGMRSPGFNAPMFTTYGGKNEQRRPKIKNTKFTHPVLATH